MNEVAGFSHYEACPRCQERGADSRGDNLGVYLDGGAHCYSCHYHRFPTHYTPTVKEEKIDKATMPSDFSREVPTAAWKWLLQYGLGYQYWKPFVGWSEEDSRLVFTVGEPTEFSIGRLIETGEQESDQKTKGKRKWFSYGDCHKTPHVFGDLAKSEQIVMVEDLISAHKVGQLCACIPLFGTNPFAIDSLIGTLRFLDRPVKLWLDSDQYRAAGFLAMKLSTYINQPVTHINTVHDPKGNSFEQIERAIS
jgi:hypothetical protein